MKFFRHALFALLLLLAQSGALTHAVDHLRIDADTPSHSCERCLAAQGLDAQLISTPSAVSAMAAACAPPATSATLVHSPAAFSPRARAPPAIL